MVCVNQIIPHMQDWKVHREREGTGCESINRCTQSQPGCSPWTLPSLGQQKKSQRGNYSVQILLLGETQLLCTVCMSFLSLVALSFVINWPIQEIKLSDTSRYHCNVLCPLDSRHDVPWKMRKTSRLGGWGPAVVKIQKRETGESLVRCDSSWTGVKCLKYRCRARERDRSNVEQCCAPSHCYLGSKTWSSQISKLKYRCRARERDRSNDTILAT